MAHSVKIHKQAQKQMLALPKEFQVKVAKAIDRLIKSPRPSGCKKLKGSELWRIRGGDIRVVYSIDKESKSVIIIKVARRREDTYKGL